MLDIYYPVDRVMQDNDITPRLPVPDIRDLNEQMQINLHDEEQTYYDSGEDLPEHMTIISDDELFEYLHPEGF